MLSKYLSDALIISMQRKVVDQPLEIVYCAWCLDALVESGLQFYVAHECKAQKAKDDESNRISELRRMSNL